MNHSNVTRASQARLQQQPSRAMDRQQQQSSGSSEFQPRQSTAPMARPRPSQMGQALHKSDADQGGI